MKWRRLKKGLLLLGALALAAYLGAKGNQMLTNPPLADLSDIKFGIPWKEKAEMPVVEVFFVTSRRAVESQTGAFQDKAGDALAYGMAQVRMPANLRVGDIQTPEIPRQTLDNRHAVVEEVKMLSPEEFRTQLEARLNQTKSHTFDLLVHGINHSFDSSLRAAATLTFNLDSPQPMIVFGWPTTPGIMPGSYHGDRSQVTLAAQHLAEFLDVMEDKVHPRSMNIIAHSLGCKVACEAFDILIKDPAWSDAETEVSNIVLAAPDVNREDFNKTFVKDMANIAKRVTVYVARNDGVLTISSYLNGGPRAGKFDADEYNLKDLVVSDASQSPHIQIIDATFVNNYLTAHSGFYQSRPAFNDLQYLLRNDLPAEERHLLKHEKEGQANYWILRP